LENDFFRAVEFADVFETAMMDQQRGIGFSRYGRVTFA
jgi:hypothetical protein